VPEKIAKCLALEQTIEKSKKKSPSVWTTENFYCSFSTLDLTHKKTKCLSQISVWHWIKWLKFEKKVSKKGAKLPSVWHWVKLLKFEKKCLKRRPEKITKCLEKQKTCIVYFRHLVMFVQILLLSDTWGFFWFLFRHLVFFLKSEKKDKWKEQTKLPSVWHLNKLLKSKRARKNYHGKQKTLIVHVRPFVMFDTFRFQCQTLGNLTSFLDTFFQISIIWSSVRHLTILSGSDT